MKIYKYTTTTFIDCNDKAKMTIAYLVYNKEEQGKCKV